MDIRTAFKLGIAQLRAANISSYTLAAELLLLHATGRNRTSLYSHPEDQLTESESQKYLSLIERRASGVPVQHLTGKQEFWGLEFEVTPDVLIPRPETEHVIEVALDRLALRDLRTTKTQNMSGEGLLIADIGTGSGCIAIALAKELPAAKIFALDVSPAALAVAQRNATKLGSSDRITFLESNLLSAVSILSPLATRHFSSTSSSAILPTSPAARRRHSRAKSAIMSPPSRSSAAKKATNSTPASSPNPPRILGPAESWSSNSATTPSPLCNPSLILKVGLTSE